MADESQVLSGGKPSWRIRVGTWMFTVPFVMFVGAPVVVPFLGFSVSEAAAIIGGIIVGSELIWFASIPLLGKEGFFAMKKKTFGIFRLKVGPVSEKRHRAGVRIALMGVGVQSALQIVLVAAYVIVDINPEQIVLGMNFEQQAIAYFSTLIVGTLLIVLGVFMLGEDFVSRLKRAFDYSGETK